MRSWAFPIMALLCACAGRASAPSAEPGSPLEGCASADCRAETYGSMYRAGAHALPPGAARCGEISTPGCDAVHWCRATVVGISGNAFDETTVVLLLGGRADSVHNASRLLEQSGSVDGEVGPAVLGTIRDEGVGVVVLERALSGREGGADLEGIEAPPEGAATQACTVVHVDACGKSVGWVCTGPDLEHQAPGGAADGLYIFEMDLGDLEPRVLSGDR